MIAMVNIGTVRGTEKPDKVIIDEYSVWINTNITEIQVTDENGSRTEWEWNQVQYEKDEYIKMIDSKNAALEKQIDDTQIALCEVYELIGG